jgi:hypothetical protein
VQNSAQVLTDLVGGKLLPRPERSFIRILMKLRLAARTLPVLRRVLLAHGADHSGTLLRVRDFFISRGANPPSVHSQTVDNALGQVDERLRLLAREAPRAHQGAHLDADGVRQIARGNLLLLIKLADSRVQLAE